MMTGILNTMIWFHTNHVGVAEMSNFNTTQRLRFIR